MKSKFPNTVKYYTIDSTELDLIKIENLNIISSLHNLVDKLEDIPQVTLCTRGDSKRNEEQQENFFEINNLKNIFIVGEKAQSNIKKTTEEKYYHAEIDNEDVLKKEIKELINEVNNEIKSKPNHHEIYGQIDYRLIENLDIEDLLKWKIFFLSFLHNSGSLSGFKSHSPFISLAHGYKKYRIARTFAFKRIKHGKAIIYLYALNNGDPYYIKTRRMTKNLKKIKVRWYEDIHNEIMLINGMYPHYLLGIFETKKTIMSKFIINPWLYEILKNNESFDYVNGLAINQENFIQLAKKLGYQNFFFSNSSGKAFISDLEEKNIDRVIEPC